MEVLFLELLSSLADFFASVWSLFEIRLPLLGFNLTFGDVLIGLIVMSFVPSILGSILNISAPSVFGQRSGRAPRKKGGDS